jgi:hypothetical protein
MNAASVGTVAVLASAPSQMRRSEQVFVPVDGIGLAAERVLPFAAADGETG